MYDKRSKIVHTGNASIKEEEILNYVIFKKIYLRIP